MYVCTERWGRDVVTRDCHISPDAASAAAARNFDDNWGASIHKWGAYRDTLTMWYQGTLGNGITRYRYTYTIVHKKRNHYPTSRSTGTGRTNAQKAVVSDEGDKVTTSRIEHLENMERPRSSHEFVERGYKDTIPIYYTYLPIYLYLSKTSIQRPNARRPPPRAFDFPTLVPSFLPCLS